MTEEETWSSLRALVALTVVVGSMFAGVFVAGVVSRLLWTVFLIGWGG